MKMEDVLGCDELGKGMRCGCKHAEDKYLGLIAGATDLPISAVLKVILHRCALFVNNQTLPLDTR